MTVIAVFVSGGLGVGLGVGAHQLEPRLLPKTSEPAPLTEHDTPPPEEPGRPTTSESASANEPAPAPEDSAAHVPARSPADVSRCVRSMFPSDSFTDENAPSLDFVCSETSYVKLSGGLKRALVNAGRGKASGGMKEWSNLGVYSLATSAVIRGRCCPNAPEPLLPETPKPCGVVLDHLTALAAVVREKRTKEDAEAPLAGFEKSVRCVLRTKQAEVFGDFGALQGGEGTTFEKTLARALQ